MSNRTDRAVRPVALSIGLGLALACGALAPRPAWAQLGLQIPSAQYFSTAGSFYDGEYRDALASYIDEQRGSVKSPLQQRWIDAICYYTMAGECSYHLGQLTIALAQYTTALEIYCANPNWMLSCTFPPTIRISARAIPVTPWGVSRRGARIGEVPDEIMMLQGGAASASNGVTQAVVVQQPVLIPIHAGEIVRAMTIAIRRRRELLGPMSKHDPLTGRVIAALATRPAPPGTWAEAWIDVQLGAAHASAENWPQAITCLQRSLVIIGEYDHPLTATALLELGLIALAMGDAASASRYFEEATYSAAIFEDILVLEEAFRQGALTHIISSQKGIYPPLLTGVAWAKAQGYRQLNASLSVMAAENFACGGDTHRAVVMLSDARAMVAQTDLMISDVGARLNHITALTCYQLGQVVAGDTALLAAMTFERLGSIWLFQLAMADTLFQNGGVNERVGLQLYETLLRDPTPFDWSLSPLDCLAVKMTPHPDIYDHWFDALMQHASDNLDVAVDVADRRRRHEFYTTLPFGGRLLALRWLLEGPAELIGDQPRMQRQEILLRYSDYEQLSQRSRQLQTALAAKPVVPETPEDRKQIVAQFNELAETVQRQELLLRQVAVRREAADLLFPPVRLMVDVQRALAPGQVLLTFVNTNQGTYAFVFGREKYTHWRVTNAAQAPKQIAGLLRELGNFEQNHLVTVADLAKDTWQKIGEKLLEILSERHLDLSARFDELIIVPDGPLWYLPFEALPINKEGTPLISHVRVRYAPTVGLAIPYRKVEKPQLRVGVINGRLYPQDDPTVSQAAFEQLSKSLPGAVAWPAAPLAPSSLYRSLFDELIVFDDIHPGEGPYDWAPAPVDRNKPGSNLDAWMHLPFGKPEKVILPGFHSNAENALKRNATGDDLFLAICGLMSSGTRTVLISRWRMGGQTCVDLVREFAQELPTLPASEAWRRSVLLANSRPLDPSSEPRLKPVRADSPELNAENPLLWSGYLLADSGRLAADDEPPPPPVLNIVKKQGPAAPAGRAAGAPPQPGAAAAPAGAASGAEPGRVMPAGKFPAGPMAPAPPGPQMLPPAAQMPAPDKQPGVNPAAADDSGAAAPASASAKKRPGAKSPPAAGSRSKTKPPAPASP